MHRLFVPMLCSSALVLGMASHANAALIFEASSSFVQPDENLVFNSDGLLSGPGLTVQGATNQTNTIFNLTGTTDLVTPAQGQARVEDEEGAGFNSLSIDALDASTFFAEFEANLNADADGVATITATDAMGMVYNFSFDLKAGGQNFFGIRAIDGQLINTVLISTNGSLQDVRQIRVGGVSGDDGPDTPGGNVPEPTSLVLLGASLLGLGIASRRR